MNNVWVWILICQIHWSWSRTTLKETKEVNGMHKLVKARGYPLERHQVVTDDKYILDIYRIPHGKTNSADKGVKPAVLLMHGLSGCSTDYVLTNPEKALGLLLADKGYDVWLGNARGNRFGRNHQTLNPNTNDTFWFFSWHEIGIYDLPATIDYITKTTKQDSIYYIGVSQGTTVFYVMASEKPEYNKKIKVMISLAPVAFMGNLVSPIVRASAAMVPYLSKIEIMKSLHELPPEPIRKLSNTFGPMACTMFQDICIFGMFSAAGFDYEQLDRSLIPLAAAYGPSGASARQFLHYAQGINSGKFRKYDYGETDNIQKYGTIEPPDYKCSQITAPVVLISGDNDWLAPPEDVEILHKELTNSDVTWIRVNYSEFNHVDFGCAKDVVKLVYEDVFRLMKKYNTV